VNPVGTDQKPYFGWFFSDPDDGELQTAYQILVSTSPEQLWAGTGDVWDSGKVLSGMQNHVEYAGRPLAAATRYYWAVRTWDKKGKAGPYSEPATFDVGLLTAADWSGAKGIRREGTDRDD
jgi:alpha-L-rhamnosidase